MSNLKDIKTDTLKSRKTDLIEALTKAQELAFSPLSFQAIASLIELNILKEIDKKASSTAELKEKLNLSDYCIETLLEVGLAIGLVKKEEDKYSTTKLGQLFLYDEMTRVNFNFVKDVCYKGAFYLTDSFREGVPFGLKELFNNFQEKNKTIYPYLSILPDKIRQSWYEFDHHYSNNCFDIIYEIIKNETKIFDIGGNTGIFEKICLKNNPSIDITMIDLDKNIDFIKDDPELKNCKFHKADILDEKIPLPNFEGSVVMSQFLDCFSKEKIEFILKRIKKTAAPDLKVYILEPFFDEQRFQGAAYSLVHTSLYFTAIANGYSKMYSKKDMVEIVEKSGYKINKEFNNLGAYDYTLLECLIDD